MENQANYNQQQYVPHQPQFSPPPPYLEEPVSLKEWIITNLILLIPLVNIVMIFVWAFGEGKASKKNYFKAQLIFVAAIIVIYILLAVIFGAAFLALVSEG